ncbi:hypothetical protein [Asticcacaulis sp.]|uniref:hypothetical protein n=1 Tax=Asticcacaulis sp. TaxID=1872648 RepID=UPI00262118A9|nr:hypothetical protein [Asticcacaulis sp.]
MWDGEGYFNNLETFPDKERWQDVALDDNVTDITATIDRGNATFRFGDWRIEVYVNRRCCEEFDYSWNKKHDDVEKIIRFRHPLPTAFTIKHYHKIFCETKESKLWKREGSRKLFCKMKNTLSFCFDNGDTLSFTNIMQERIYEHVIRLYKGDEQVLFVFI